MSPTKPRVAPVQAPPRILERTDGFYWLDPETGGEFGPFETREAAMLDRDASIEEEADDETGGSDALHEVEDELGVSDWLDPDTGLPAEGQVPRFADDDF